MKPALSSNNIVFITISNAGWIISKILYIFFNVDRINQWHLSKNEASRHSIYFKIALMQAAWLDPKTAPKLNRQVLAA